MLKPSILNSLRKATDISIRFDPTTIELIPHQRVNLGGGAWKLEPQSARPPQTFLVQSVGATLQGITGTGAGKVKTEGAEAHSWSYTITGRYDCVMAIGDIWKNGGTVYRIEAIQPENGYEKVGMVSALGIDPKYG